MAIEEPSRQLCATTFSDFGSIQPLLLRGLNQRLALCAVLDLMCGREIYEARAGVAALLR